MNNDVDSDKSSATGRLGPWGWFALAVLAVFLVVAAWYGVYAWGRLGGVLIAPMGWVFLIAGIVVPFLVGAGLMALLFYSSRSGHDI